MYVRNWKEDCELTHENSVGAEAGPVLRTGTYTKLPVSKAPEVPIQLDFQIDEDENVVDERAYKTALLIHSGELAVWHASVKASTHHKINCESKYLPALYAWVFGRLDHDLKSRLMQCKSRLMMQ